MKTKKEPKLNVRLLRRVQKWIEQEPRRFRIGWFKRGNVPNQPQSPCNTTACIAGAALVLSGKRKIEDNYSTSIRAKKLLGLNDVDGDKLFCLSDWPYKFQKGYTNELSFLGEQPLTSAEVERNAKIAVRRIEHFIRTRQ